MSLPETTRFILKEIIPEDIENIHRGLSDTRVTQYYAVHFETLEDTREQMDWYADLVKNGTGMWWGVYNKETGEFCGAGGYNDLDGKHKKAEIGFWLLPEFWRRGIMQEVMPKLLELGFEKLGLNRIEGFVDSRNTSCKAAIQKLNFYHEGTLRQAEIEDGEYLDVDIFSFLQIDR
ncbi:GNAT family N-acetyltransferase [Salinimicrobium soli]|uniref:GNAT family N-acetyltransferase n=1 Tax=Salinimicrobium soli TaxID=1254399 RepID=UPI003AB03178